jgi:hypothetical protein
MSDVAVQQAPPAESSPAAATFEVPSDSEQYAEWRQTGKLPEAKAPKVEKPAASKESVKAAPASEAGKETTQEHERSNAATRLAEVLADLKRAGLSPAELKTFKREAKAAEAAPAAATPEQTAKPAEAEALKKPKIDDFKTIDEYEDAKDKYYEALTEQRAKKLLADFRQEEAAKASKAAMDTKLAEARQRYGEASDSTISTAAKALFAADNGIPGAVKALLDQSPVLVDLMYVLGSKAEDLAALVQLGRTDPGAAIRKIVLLEKLTQEELAKAPSEGKAPAVRGEDGKFVAAEETPEKPKTKAPEPPKEVSGRGAVPQDEIEGAFKANDFTVFRNAANRRDLKARQGR